MQFFIISFVSFFCVVYIDIRIIQYPILFESFRTGIPFKEERSTNFVKVFPDKSTLGETNAQIYLNYRYVNEL